MAPVFLAFVQRRSCCICRAATLIMHLSLEKTRSTHAARSQTVILRAEPCGSQPYKRYVEEGYRHIRRYLPGTRPATIPGLRVTTCSSSRHHQCRGAWLGLAKPDALAFSPRLVHLPLGLTVQSFSLNQHGQLLHLCNSTRLQICTLNATL